MKRPMENRIKILSPAKINLYLEVTGKRADGYHLLETVFQAVELYDEMTLELHSTADIKTPKIQITSSDPGLPVDDRNLAYRAAMAFFESTGICGHARIHLEKRIPIAAGLGGGSSNAAAVLKGLSLIYAHKMDRESLWTMASRLGADVPFFLGASCALGTGIGDELREIDAKLDFYLVLVNPKFPVITRDIYASLSWPLTAHNGNIRMTELALTDGDFNLLCRNLYNRLEAVVLDRFPNIIELKQKLEEWGAPGVLLSGSGPTVFAVFEHENDALRVQSCIDDKYGEKFWSTCCRTLHAGGTDGNNTGKNTL